MEFFMSYGTILTKGEISVGATDFPVVPKQFILMSGEGSAKRLLVRFENRRKERLDSLSLTVRQYDIRGSLLRKDTYEIETDARQGEFAPERDFPVLAACEDFKIEVSSCTYGNYKYFPRDSRTQIVYENKSVRELADRTPAFASMHERRHRAAARTLRSPWFFIPLALLTVLALSLFVAIRVTLFVNQHETFTLGGMKYMLTSDAEDCNTVSFIGSSLECDEIVIPDYIEGYRVVSVAKHALKGSPVKTVKIMGDTVIEPYAFEKSSLVSVCAPAVKDIGEGAFSGLSSLSEITLSDTLAKIGDKAFFGCSSLSSVSLADTLQSIGSEAFSGCSSLTELTIPDSVERMGASILDGADSLEALTLPFIGKSASEPTTLSALIGKASERAALKALTVTLATEISGGSLAGESALEVIKFNKDITAVGESALSGCSALKEFVLPATCTSIGKNAFSGCSSLASLDFKAGVTAIPERMLYGCSSLVSLDIPATVASVGGEAFSGCSSLAALSLGEAVKSIGVGAVHGCSSLAELSVYELPSGVTPLTMFANNPMPSLKLVRISHGKKIEKDAFLGFEGLEFVYLPAELDEIGESAFSGCKALKVMSIPLGTSKIGKSAFSGCSSLPSVVIPSAVSEIPEAAFLGCTALGTAELPGGLNAIGKSAFENCRTLVGVKLGDSMVSLGESAFSGCSALSYATLGSSLEYVSKNAFSGCSSLGSISLPSNIKILNDGAFAGCSSVTVLAIPSTVVKIGEGVFSGCSSLRELSLSFVGASAEDDEDDKVSYLFAGKAPASLKKLMLDGLSEIPAGIFDGLEYIEEIILTTCKVAEIEPFCFKNLNTLQRVRLPIGVIELGEGAFMGCRGLVSVNLPDSLRIIGDRAFYLCTSLPSVSFNSELYSIGNGAFMECRSLLSAAVPTGVVSVGHAAFAGCSSLLTYSAPFTGVDKDTHKLSNVFGGVSESLKQIVITRGTVIGNEAFYGFASVTDITVPDSVKSFGADAFAGCASLTRINMPTALRTVGERAFSGCASIKSIEFPNGLDAIGAFALDGCSSLESISVPFVGLTRQTPARFHHIFNDDVFKVPRTLKSITVSGSVSLAPDAFASLVDVEQINLVGGVTDIGIRAFFNCLSLRSVTLSGNLESIGANAFLDAERLRTVINKTGKDISSMLSSSGAMEYVLCVTDDEMNISTVDIDGFTMLLGDDGSWYCVDFDEQLTGEILVLPDEFEFDGDVVDEYKVARRLMYVDYKYPSAVTSVHISSAVTEICDRAFYNSNIRTLTAASDTVITRIGREAFFDSDSLTVATIPATVTEIGDDAFLDCESLVLVYNLSDLPIVAGDDGFGFVAKYAESVIKDTPLPMTTVTVGDFVLEGVYNLYFLKKFIGNSTVADIRNITASGVDVTSIIILDGAFDGSSVRRVILGECVCRIHDGAFDGADSIYEVVDLSDRVSPDTMLPEECGGVVRNAIYVFDSDDEQFTYYEQQNKSGRFLFATYGSEAYLLEADAIEDTLVIPDKIGTNAISFSIFRTAFDRDELDGLKLVMPITAEHVHSDITGAADNTVLMYMGTAQELSVILDTTAFLKVVYFAYCVHDDFTFTLDADGMPVTDYTETDISVTDEPTCTEDGEMTESCDICHSEWTTVIPSGGHSLVGGLCGVCGYREDVTVSGDEINIYDFLSVSGSSLFTLSDGVLSASVTRTGATAALTISARDTCTVSFDYSATGNAGAFSLSIRKGMQELVKHTSATSTGFSINLTLGDALIIILTASDASGATATVSSLSIVYP